jgi:hypothetical protein
VRYPKRLLPRKQEVEVFFGYVVVILSQALYFALTERAGDKDCYNYPLNAWLRFFDGLIG